MRALCDPVQREALHLRWQGICNALVARAELGGIDATDITFTGTPLRLDIGSWCSVVLVEGATTPTVMIREP